MNVGRNEPCPCGSGRKHKHCCLGRERPPSQAPAQHFTDDDRHQALRRLGGWAFSDEATFQEALREFYDPAAELLSGPEMPGHMREQEGAFNTWLLFDRPGRLGASACETFLGLRGRQLPDGQAAYLRRMQAARWRPYEVQAVRPGQGFELLDLWSHQRFSVREHSASQQVGRWTLLGARLTEQEPGVWELEGGLLAFPPALKQPLLDGLEARRAALALRYPELDEDGLLRRLAPAFHTLWVRLVARPPVPRLTTPEGHDVVFCRVVFDVDDAAAVRAALLRVPGLEPDGRRFEWLEDTGDGRRVLGSLAFEGGRLVLETQSEPRAAAGRELLERELGAAVRFRSLRRKDARRALERRPRTPPPPRRSDVPPEIEAALLQDFYEKHYRDWVDHPLPALDGLTPREAARRPAERERVRELLKQFEHGSEAERREGRPAYDFGWMWKELGLRRG